MKVNAVIFDMDGLLFDTEIVYYEASQTVADWMGFPYDKDLYLRFLGVSDEEVWANYHTIFASFGRETVQKFIDDSYQETLDRFALGQVELKPGVLEFLKFLEEKDIPKVVASSNQRHVIELLLEKIIYVIVLIRSSQLKMSNVQNQIQKSFYMPMRF